MATMHFHKVQTCVSFRNVFFVLRGSQGTIGLPKTSPKGAREAKLVDIKIGHLLTNFRKTAYFW